MRNGWQNEHFLPRTPMRTSTTRSIANYQGGVEATETTCANEHIPQFFVACLVRNNVQGTTRILLFAANGWQNSLIFHAQQGHNDINSRGSVEKATKH